MSLLLGQQRHSLFLNIMRHETSIYDFISNSKSPPTTKLGKMVDQVMIASLFQVMLQTIIDLSTVLQAL